MPVYAIQQGLGEVVGAVVVSAGNGLLFLAPIAGGLARRYGVRRVLRVGFFICGIFTFAAGLLFDSPAAVITLLLLATIGTVMMDAVGNVPFLASVRPREREEMTTVFRTYLDASDLIPPALFALVLSFFDLRVVFLIQGCITLAFIALLAFLPQRLGMSRIRIGPEGPLPGAAAAPAIAVMPETESL
jgi:MFS family permease